MRARFTALRGTIAHATRRLAGGLAKLQGVAGAALVSVGVYGLTGVWWALVTLGGFLLVGAWGS